MNLHTIKPLYHLNMLEFMKIQTFAKCGTHNFDLGIYFWCSSFGQDGECNSNASLIHHFECKHFYNLHIRGLKSFNQMIIIIIFTKKLQCTICSHGVPEVIFFITTFAFIPLPTKLATLGPL
jgi:hypothetical protein